MCGRAYDPRFLFTWPNSRPLDDAKHPLKARSLYGWNVVCGLESIGLTFPWKVWGKRDIALTGRHCVGLRYFTRGSLNGTFFGGIKLPQHIYGNFERIPLSKNVHELWVGNIKTPWFTVKSHQYGHIWTVSWHLRNQRHGRCAGSWSPRNSEAGRHGNTVAWVVSLLRLVEENPARKPPGGCTKPCK